MENTIHVIGEADPVLRCSIEGLDWSDILLWIEYVTHPVNGRTVARSDVGVIEGLEDKYNLDEGNFKILNANLNDSGPYECRNILAPVVQMSAELLVLGE